MTVQAIATSAVTPRRGFFVNVGSLVFARAFLAVSQILVLPILARHLTVEEFAVMALAMTVVIFAGVMSDAGLGRSLIRSPTFSQAEWSTVFWLLVGVGLLLALGIAAAAPVWAWIFEAPSLWGILTALAIVPFLQAISAAPNAEIERREDYAGIARLQLIAAVAGLIAAVALALAGAGVWALVAQQLIVAAVRTAGIAFLTEFRPDFVFARRLIGSHLRFARDTVSTSLISVFQTQATTMVIGKLIGAGPLGIFAMSQRFTRLPQFGLAGPMSAVVYVRMAKAQDSPEKLVSIYLAAIRLLAAIMIPPLAMIAVGGTAIFTVLLSDKWAAVAPIFAFSIPGIALEAVSITCLVCLFRALGRTDLQVRLTVEGTALCLPLVLGAAMFGLEAVAASLTVWALLYIPRGWQLAQRVVPLKLKDCIAAIAWPGVVASAAVLAHLVIRSKLSPDDLAETVLAIALTFAAYLFVAVGDRNRLRLTIALLR